MSISKSFAGAGSPVRFSHGQSLPSSIDLLSRRERGIFLGLVALWFVTLIGFWRWWLEPQHFVSMEGTLICSALMAWNTLLPAYYYYFVWRMKHPNPNLSIPKKWRIAMVVTKAPSEPWSVVQRTLQGMIAQDIPHDNWLADEAPSRETLDWCRRNGVRVSTRYRVAGYHRSRWPRRTQCKEGNLAYFYDHYGYENYDFVSQLDADHMPSPGYLEALLIPFLDDRIGYVAAPSICGANARRSWVVRARLYAEATMHGSLQAGYSDGWAPLCIGSHYAVRTQALQSIGGLGPELAEDHTTTLMMNALGWRGGFAMDAEAHGDGPESFADFLLQEYQWARSLMIVLLTVTPRYIGRLPLHLKFQFLFSQMWYPIFAMTMLVGVCLPILALIFDRPWMNVDYLGFVIRQFILTITCVLPVVLVKRAGALRPGNAKIISWEAVLFQFARWPWIAIAVGNATVSCILNQEISLKVTPKGDSDAKPLPFNLMVPYLVLAMASGLVVLVCGNGDSARGYYFLACLNTAIYGGLCLVVLNLHFSENLLRYRDYLVHFGAVCLTFCILMLGIGVRGAAGIRALWDGDLRRSILSIQQESATFLGPNSQGGGPKQSD
jgi:cellulose synthase (UDP-forming)